jgi:predicted phosphodiesterase
MRIAVFSDVHGNLVGFDTMLADLRGTPVDQMICLGDVAQGGPQPAQCLDRLAQLGCPVVMGNSDQFLLDPAPLDQSAEPVTERHLKVRAWSLRQLQPRHLDFIRSFQLTVEVGIGEGGSLLCFHGSPTSFDQVILPETPDEEFERMIAGHWATLMAGGHVHLQWMRRHGGSLFFNPGSVGLAYDHRQPEDGFRFDARAEYAVVTVETGRLSVDFRRVDVGVDEVVEAIEGSGMPYAAQNARQWRPH